MKKILKKIIVSLIRIWSMLYTINNRNKIVGYRNILYTLWIRNFINKTGEHSIIQYPCSLQGKGNKHIIIGDFTTLESHTILGCWEKYGEQVFTPEIVIGDNCRIGEYTHITACNKITIGNGLLTGRYVYIGDNSHGGLSWEEANTLPVKRILVSKGGVKIGNNVWIGDKVSILGGVSIGDNVIIGTGSIVTHDIPANSIVAGVPAKIVKQL